MYEKEFFYIDDISTTTTAANATTTAADANATTTAANTTTTTTTTTTTVACQPRPFKWSPESGLWVTGLPLYIIGLYFIPEININLKRTFLVLGILLFFIGFIIDVKNWSCTSRTTNNEKDWGDTERALIAGILILLLFPINQDILIRICGIDGGPAVRYFSCFVGFFMWIICTVLLVK
jgi:hypothetical protein